MMEWQKKLQAGMKDLPKPDEPNVPEPESITNAKLSIVSFGFYCFLLVSTSEEKLLYGQCNGSFVD